jgi:ribosomal protein L24
MGEKKTNPVVIDGVEYLYEDMKPEQQTLLGHIVDLDRKLNSAKMNIDQLQVGRDAFFTMLKQSLDKVTEAK